MNKFNRRFNNSCARIAFWHNLTAHIAFSEQFIKAQTHLTPEDVKALKVIHRGLFDCYKSALQRLKAHQQYLLALRKEAAKN